MTDVKVFGFDPQSGKYYRAVRGEPGSRAWAWMEVNESEVAKPPEHEAGDLVYKFSSGAMMAYPTIDAH
jgi:hypothetical protein